MAIINIKDYNAKVILLFWSWVEGGISRITLISRLDKIKFEFLQAREDAAKERR